MEDFNILDVCYKIKNYELWIMNAVVRLTQQKPYHLCQPFFPTTYFGSLDDLCDNDHDPSSKSGTNFLYAASLKYIIKHVFKLRVFCNKIPSH